MLKILIFFINSGINLKSEQSSPLEKSEKFTESELSSEKSSSISERFDMPDSVNKFSNNKEFLKNEEDDSHLFSQSYINVNSDKSFQQFDKIFDNDFDSEKDIDKKNFKNDSKFLKELGIQGFKRKKSLIRARKNIEKVFGKIDFKIDKEIYSNWIEFLPENLKNKKILKFFFPGTHESAVHKINFSNPIPKKKSFFNKALDKFNDKIGVVGLATKNWTITQSKTISKQLEIGVRLFDLRISYNTKNKKIYITHTFVVEELENVLNEFDRFLNQHEQEIIIINIKKDFENKETFPSDYHEAIKVFTQHNLYYKCLPKSDWRTDLKINDIISKKINALIFWKGVSNERTLNASLSNEHWLRANSVNSKIKELQKSLNFDFGKLNYLNCTVTPDISTTLKNLSLSKVANSLNEKLDKILKYDHVKQSNGLIMDFVNIEDTEKMIFVNFD